MTAFFSKWRRTGSVATLASFDGANGSSPEGDLVETAGGNLYGTTSNGGSEDGGNIFEFILREAPVILSISEAATNLTFTWSAVPGQTYRVQYRYDLSQGSWTDLGAAVIAKNATMVTTDSIAPEPQRFYRVLLQ